MARPHPWADPDATWYAALEVNGVPYNIARRSHVAVPGKEVGIIDECLDLATGAWIPAPGGYQIFAGDTDGAPISEAEAMRLIARLIRPGSVIGDSPDLTYPVDETE